MTNFKDRVMGAIGNDVDGDDAENPISPMVGTPAAGRHVPPRTPQEGMGEGVGENGIDEIGEGPEPGIDAPETGDGPQELTPVGPGVDDIGNVLKPFTCRQCGVLDHAPESMIEIQNRWGVLCLPCRAPWRFKWKRDPDTGDKFLFPVPGGGKPRTRLGEPERRELELRATELIDLQLRRDFLITTIVKLQEELTHVEPRIVELKTTTIPTAQNALEAIEGDPKLEKRQKAADIAHDIGLAIAAVLKAKSKKPIRR